MADAVLELGIELAESLLVTDWHEHRVIAEPALAAWRPHEDAVDASVERLRLPVVGPGDRQRAGEVRGRRRIRLGHLNLAPNPFHRTHPVAVALSILGPTSRENTGASVERVDAQAAVVRERRKPGQVRRFARLQVRIVGEAVADLL